MEGQVNSQENTGESQIKKDFLNDIDKIESQAAPDNIGPSVAAAPSFVCPDSILDMLQDLPTKTQKLVLCKGLTPEQKKAVESIFEPREHERTINRKMIKSIIEKVCTRYPEAQKYFSDELFFFIMNGGLVLERAQAVEEVKKAHPAPVGA